MAATWQNLGVKGRTDVWTRVFEKVATARARPLSWSMIFGPCAAIFSIQRANQTHPHPSQSSPSRRGTISPNLLAEWFYDFMLHFVRFVDRGFPTSSTQARRNVLNFSDRSPDPRLFRGAVT